MNKKKLNNNLKKVKNNKILTYNICYLKLRLTRKNIYLTLTDYLGQVILKISSGIIKKKLKLTFFKKNTAYAMELLFQEFIKELKEKKFFLKLIIIQVEGFLGNNINKKFMKLLVEESYIYNKIYILEKKMRFAHNGVRLRKPKKK